MKKLNTYFLFPLAALVILVFGLSSQMFNAPPLGKLLDPFAGIVQNAEDQALLASQLDIPAAGISRPVNVFFDERKVPHIYAQNTEDLYFAQGYVTACLRLWQMDFISYASAGRLSEIFKDGFLDYDRVQRRTGMLDAAIRSLELIEKDPETRQVLSAYSRGVNAYIDQLTYKTFPLEYKLLDYAPEAWSNLKTVLIMKYMGNTLTGYEEDISMTNMILALGEERFNMLFPDFHAYISPVVNKPVPQQLAGAVSAAFRKPSYLDYSFLSSDPVVSKSTHNPRLGSNNWAVSGKKTRSGYPILCNDPHLNLSFPCIWLEMQLCSPGLNVYGVSIPGTPAVIIGFNEHIAWGVTNGATDVSDWYKLKITNDYKKYELDGKWLELTYRIEEIKRREQKSFYDTVYRTIHGPLVYNKSFPLKKEALNYALRWELDNPSNEFRTFIRLNRAKNYADYKEALSSYACPIQNFVFAGKNNDIAINHQGNMVKKWQGQGRFVLDGTRSEHLYKAYIPADSLPQAFNPECNYVFSANQHPTSAEYPFYYNGYYSETRANRISKLLSQENSFDMEKMQSMQLDNTNAFAVEAFPVLLNKLKKNMLEPALKKLPPNFMVWNGTYNLDDRNAEFFERWWYNIKWNTWDELRSYPFGRKAPDDYILLDLIQNTPHDPYFDQQGTAVKELAEDIVSKAFTAALDEYMQKKKEGHTRWSDFNKVNILHLTNIEAFSTMDLPSPGHPEAINAMSAYWGPSWRMIVELGERPRAFGVYPGGQSGNIGSTYYDNFVGHWNKGLYYPLHFFVSMSEAKTQKTNMWTLKPRS